MRKLLFLLALAAVVVPRSYAQLSPAFVDQAKEALDMIDRVDKLAAESTYSTQHDRAGVAVDKLSRIAATEPERTVVKQISSYLFRTETCHITASPSLPAARFSECLDKETAIRQQALMLLGWHKEGGVWAPGPPKRE